MNKIYKNVDDFKNRPIEEKDYNGFSSQELLEKSNLEFCTGCWNCWDCYACTDCVRCSHSYRLLTCRDCGYCQTCSSCVDCFYSEGIADRTSVDNCVGYKSTGKRWKENADGRENV